MGRNEIGLNLEFECNRSLFKSGKKKQALRFLGLILLLLHYRRELIFHKKLDLKNLIFTLNAPH
jgi:hypothetical protein